MRSRIQPVRPSHGFTLVELLVVMAIIGLLIAMLLVSLTKWRETTRKTWCRTNLHQIGIAMHSYETDFDGVAVMVGADPYVWGNATGFAPSSRYANADQLWHKTYMTDVSIMRCPSVFEHDLINTDTNTPVKSRFASYTDEQIFGSPWEWGDPNTNIPAMGVEQSPYWLFGVSQVLGPPQTLPSPPSRGFEYPWSTPRIYWIRPSQYEDTLQVQVQDAVMTAEVARNGKAYPLAADVYQSNHAIRAEVRIDGGAPEQAWRGEGGNALRVDGSVEWYALPRQTEYVSLSDPPSDFAKYGYEKKGFVGDTNQMLVNDWIGMHTYGNGAGAPSYGPLMVRRSSSMIRCLNNFRGDVRPLWEAENLFGKLLPIYTKPKLGRYDRRTNLNFNP